MSTNRFEDLPNEIIRQVFSYLLPQDLMKGWANINGRLNRLIFSLDYNISFIGRNVTKQSLAAAFVLCQKVVSLRVTKRWCDKIKYYRNLRALHVVDLTPQFSISQLRPEMFPHLKYVEYAFEHFHWNDFMEINNCHYARQLVRCYVCRLKEPPIICCSTLRSVRITFCSSEYLLALLRVAPNLTDMDIGGLHADIDLDLANLEIIGIETITTGDEDMSFVPPLAHHFESTQHNQLRRIKLRFDCGAALEWIDEFLSCTPNVTHFSLCVGGALKIFSFEELHRITTLRLPKLIPGEFRLEYSCLEKPFDLLQHQAIGPLFRNMIAEIKTYEHQQLSLIKISVNWKNNDNDDTDDYTDFDDY